MAKNAVTTTTASTAVAAPSSNLAALQAFAQENKVVTNRFCRFHGIRGELITKDSDRNEIVLKVGSKFVVNLPEIYHGYICWKDGAVVDQYMVRLLDVQKLPAIETLPDHGPYNEAVNDGWRATIATPMKSLDDSIDYVYQATGGSHRVQSNLIGKLIQSASLHDLDKEAAVVEYGKTTYKNKFTKRDMPLPTWKIVEWKKYADLDLKVSARPLSDDEEPAPLANGQQLLGTAVNVED